MLKLTLNEIFVLFGAIHKGCPHPRGEGGSVKSGHMRTQGGGGIVAKSGRPQIPKSYQNFQRLDSVLCAKRQNLTQ